MEKYFERPFYCFEIKHTPSIKREHLKNMNFEINEGYLHL